MTLRNLNFLGGAALMALLTACVQSEDGSQPAPDETREAAEETSADKVAREAEEAVEEAARFAEQERDAFAEDAERRMNQLNEKLSELRSEWRLKRDTATEEAAERWERTLESLEQQRREASETLERLRTASGPAWKDIRGGFTEAYDEFSRAVDDAEAQINGEDVSEGESKNSGETPDG